MGLFRATLALAHILARYKRSLIAVLSVSAIIAILAGPSERVSNYPVVAQIEAHPDARLDICWPRTCASFVRKPQKSGDPEIWLAELPPLRQYTLVVQTRGLRATVRSLKVIRTNTLESAPVFSSRPEN